MSNQDVETAQSYHETTKLTYINLHNKPPLYKSYTGLPVVPLPTDFSPPRAATLDAVAAVDPARDASLDISALAQLLFFSAGLVRKAVHPSAGEMHYRAAASAGALYPVEVYLVCEDIPGPVLSGVEGLEAGVYHFSPLNFTVTQLRKGDYRGELSSAAGGDPAISTSPSTLIFTAIFWRSAWKYRVRSYRYCFWDNGTIVANLLATTSAAGLRAKVVAAFVDDEVDRLLGIKGGREASLCLVPIGKGDGSQPDAGHVNLTPLLAEAAEVSGDEMDYPEIRQLHVASSLATREEVTAWRGVLASGPPQGQGPFHPLRPVGESGAASAGLGEVITGRGSTRRFARDPISYSQFSAMLDRSTSGVPADFLGEGGASLLDIYVIVNAVEGLPSGSYFFSPQRRGLELLREGVFREEAGHLCFEQALGADASAVVFFMADLKRVLGRYGNRGYRAAQLEAGIVGGRVYLCAHSLGLGASGITFYDNDVADFFSPHADGKSATFVVVLGVTAQINRVRPFRSRVGVMLDALARGAAKRKE